MQSRYQRCLDVAFEVRIHVWISVAGVHSDYTLFMSEDCFALCIMLIEVVLKGSNKFITQRIVLVI